MVFKNSHPRVMEIEEKSFKSLASTLVDFLGMRHVLARLVSISGIFFKNSTVNKRNSLTYPCAGYIIQGVALQKNIVGGQFDQLDMPTNRPKIQQILVIFFHIRDFHSMQGRDGRMLKTIPKRLMTFMGKKRWYRSVGFCGDKTNIDLFSRRSRKVAIKSSS